MVMSHQHTLTRVTIDFSEQLSSGIFLFGFPREFEFRAGQVIGISLEENGPRRLYSISSGERDDRVLILYNVVEEGYLTPRLAALETGDPIWITEPRGEFTSNTGPAVWIATGTGIAPFYSMLRSGLAADKVLIHGNRFLEQFHFYDEFLEVMGDRYIRCCTLEHSEDVYPGRVTEFLLESGRLDKHVNYYLCGSAEMVVDTRDVLISKGIPFDRIISEIYF
jgi:ferredoxin/flavodoxin---NADP+ reductase